MKTKVLVVILNAKIPTPIFPLADSLEIRAIKDSAHLAEVVIPRFKPDVIFVMWKGHIDLLYFEKLSSVATASNVRWIGVLGNNVLRFQQNEGQVPVHHLAGHYEQDGWKWEEILEHL